MKTFLKFAVAFAGLAAMTLQTTANPIIDKKLGQFGLEPRVKVTCVKEAKGDLPFGGSWKTCIGHKYETQFLQHSFHLVVDGPPLEEAARQVLEEAVAAAASAALGAGLVTPSPEPGARIGAALAAAKATFVSYLTVRGFDELLSKYTLKIDDRTHWS